MILTVKLFATLREGRKKIEIMDMPEGVTAVDVLRNLKINEAEVAVFLVNGVNSELKRTLKDKDVLSIFPPVGGG